MIDLLTLIDWDKAIEDLHRAPERHPVLNHEPRVQMGGRKWHLIHERDGGVCWMCSRHVPKGSGEVDHLKPRSAFEVKDLPIADRSDNLKTACIDCNQRKSNFDRPRTPRTVGVTSKCWECSNDCGIDPEFDPGAYADYWADRFKPTMTVAAYCGRCGYTWVPDKSWLL